MTNASPLVRGAAIGIGSGLLAAWLMNRLQSGWTALEQRVQPSDDGSSGQEEPSTVKAADRLAVQTSGERVPEPYREAAGETVHYAFGAIVGAVYGAAAVRFPTVRTGFGTLYGAAVALTADEMLVPAAGLSPPPQETPPSKHVYSLASHLVSGAALEADRRGLEAMIESASERYEERQA